MGWLIITDKDHRSTGCSSLEYVLISPNFPYSPCWAWAEQHLPVSNLLLPPVGAETWWFNRCNSAVVLRDVCAQGWQQWRKRSGWGFLRLERAREEWESSICVLSMHKGRKIQAVHADSYMQGAHGVYICIWWGQLAAMKWFRCVRCMRKVRVTMMEKKNAAAQF